MTNPKTRIISPSVGGVLKKLMVINPALTAQDMIGIIKQSVQGHYGLTDGFTKNEVIDEAKAIQLAQATLL